MTINQSIQRGSRNNSWNVVYIKHLKQRRIFNIIAVWCFALISVTYQQQILNKFPLAPFTRLRISTCVESLQSGNNP